MCLSVLTIPFDPLHIGTSFLVWRYILTISRSRLSIMSLGQGTGHVQKMIIYLFQFVISLCFLQSINKVKVTYQGQGCTLRSRSNQCQDQIDDIFKERYSCAGGLHLNQMSSC